MKKTLSIIVILFIAFVLLIFFWGSSPQLKKEDYNKIEVYNNSSKKNDSILSIVTYNIGYLSGLTNNLALERPIEMVSANMTKVKSTFEKLNASFIAFQEIDFDSSRSFNVNQQKELASLGYDYGGIAINWDKKYVPFPYWPPTKNFGKIVSGQSLLSHYEIIEQESIILDRPKNIPFWKNAFYLDRLMQIASIKCKDKTIKIMNIHLEAFDKNLRKKQTLVVKKKFMELVNKFPTLLVGDFNSDAADEDAAIQTILNIPNLVAAIPNFNKKTYPSIDSNERLDYILYDSTKIDKISAKIIQKVQDASDHLPVYMSFKLK